MFRHEYQGGPHLDVFTAQGRDPIAGWKLAGSVKRDYDKGVRGYVYVLEGGASTTNTRMELPADKASLSLLQPYCVFQMMVPTTARLAIDLSICDGSSSRRRILLSSSLREISATPLNARVPLRGLCTGQWVNLCIDMASLVSGLFKGQDFKSLEGISLGGSCKLRRIFTLKAPPLHTAISHTYPDGVEPEEIPRVCEMPSGVVVDTQVLCYDGLIIEGQSESIGSAHVSSSGQRPTHVAFGKKVAIPDHILSSRQSSRGSRHPTTAPTVTSLRTSQPSVQLEAVGLQPHPPSKPADPSLLRIQKKRLRMISGVNERRSSPKTSLQQSTQQSSRDTNSVQYTSEVHRTSRELSSESTATNSIPPSKTPPIDSGYGTSGLINLSSDEQLAIEILQKINISQDSTNRVTAQDSRSANSHQVATEDSNDTSHFIAAGEVTADEDSINNTQVSAEDSINTSQEDYSNTSHFIAAEDSSELYLYRSIPKSTGNVSIATMELGGRKVKLEDDFVDNEQEVHAWREEGIPLTEAQTRLSDDYDWRVYSGGDAVTQSDMSLRTRLETKHQVHVATHHISAGPPHHNSTSSEIDETLSASMTLSGWTEQYKDVTEKPLYDSLDTRSMGGMLSPAIATMVTMATVTEKSAENKEECGELDLLYDAQLNCFYDPVTCKYYELES